MTTLEEIRDLEAGAAYPGFVLEDCTDALVLFAAGFLGKQDAYWIADAGLRATCVDSDQELLDEMRAMYPPSWTFLRADVWKGAENAAAREEKWDLVSLDPWTRDFNRCAENLPLWCALARRAIVLGTGWNTKVEAPEGWAVTDVRKRSSYDGGVFWTVLERA